MDEPFVPADIWVDDQGTDGAGAGENWSGTLNCTDADQDQTDTNKLFYTGDEILSAEGDLYIATNNNYAAARMFNGTIDWLNVTVG